MKKYFLKNSERFGYRFLWYSLQDHHEARNGGVNRMENKIQNRVWTKIFIPFGIKNSGGNFGINTGKTGGGRPLFI